MHEREEREEMRRGKRRGSEDKRGGRGMGERYDLREVQSREKNREACSTTMGAKPDTKGGLK